MTTWVSRKQSRVVGGWAAPAAAPAIDDEAGASLLDEAGFAVTNEG